MKLLEFVEGETPQLLTDGMIIKMVSVKDAHNNTALVADAGVEISNPASNPMFIVLGAGWKVTMPGWDGNTVAPIIMTDGDKWCPVISTNHDNTRYRSYPIYTGPLLNACDKKTLGLWIEKFVEDATKDQE